MSTIGKEAGKLRPCPFCGGEARLHDYGGLPAYVDCSECYCALEPAQDQTAAGAIAAWNRRAAHDELVAALDGLLKANDAVQDVLCDGPEVPGFDPTALGRAQSLVTEAETVARLALSRAKGEA